MTIDTARRLQALYVPVGDGVRLAADVWLPVERIAAEGAVGTVVRATRYHRSQVPPGPGPAEDSNRPEGDLWNEAGFALVVVDARGTGASFGSRSGELGEREIADYGEVVDWVAAQPWSNGRVGFYGTSYEGQAAELVAGLRNPHVVAAAALFSPYDPYRQLFYPGGSATSGRFARWMCESRLKDGVAGSSAELAALTGLPPESVPLPPPVKPVDGPDGPALLEEAVGEHQDNVDVSALLDRVPCRDDGVEGLDWKATAPASHRGETEASDVPLLIRAGWIDGAFAAGALMRFAALGNHQEVEIGPWDHGGRALVDPLRPAGVLEGDRFGPEGQGRRLVDFFARYLRRDSRDGRPGGRGKLGFCTLGTEEWRTVGSWPPEGLGTRRWYPGPRGGLTEEPGPRTTLRYRVDPATSSGGTNRWLAGESGRGAAYPGRGAADEALPSFTTPPFPDGIRVLGFPLVALRLATTGSDGAVYVYLDDVGPDGVVSYLTEGCLRFVHRGTAGPAGPAGLGVPRSFTRADRLPVVPGRFLHLAVELLPVSFVLRAGHRIRVSVAGHDASCFARYGPPDETFTLALGEDSYLDLPVLAPAEGTGP
ncbi:CocE/NonD family hydrolase [Nocardiopsis sp. NPDC058631]|uniref:CocE/NonD family hydrolase n=1 Tax=Nocardiopsis sp. NPDC058631 TaxID=3346566 RepID=UPI003646CABA